MLTDTHLVVIYSKASRESWIEVFALPSNSNTAGLSRTHITYCPFWITHATPLQASYTQITLVVAGRCSGGPVTFQSEVALLRLVLMADGSINVATPHLHTPEIALLDLSVTADRDGRSSRVIAYGFTTANPSVRLNTYLIPDSVSSYAASYCALWTPWLGHEQLVTADAFTGRLCWDVSHPGSPTILVCDYV